MQPAPETADATLQADILPVLIGMQADSGSRPVLPSALVESGHCVKLAPQKSTNAVPMAAAGLLLVAALPVDTAVKAGPSEPACTSMGLIFGLPDGARDAPEAKNAHGANQDPALEALAKPVVAAETSTATALLWSTMRDAGTTATSALPPIAPPVITAIDRHLDLARGDAWLDTLAQDIVATAAHGGRLRFTLMPQALGRLDIDMQQSSAGLNLHMTADKPVVREMLAAAQPRIVDEIRAQGVRVAGTEVAAGTTANGGDRAGTPLRQPFTTTIEASPRAALAAETTPETATDGRYA